ncbi:MAG: UDP-3-O-(3-hydroxymyristoyl)glucosamine N-acyltransferase [Tissierellaceae bacterium]
MSKIKIKRILQFLDESEYKYEFIGNRNDYVYGFSEIDNYNENTISWIKNKNKFENIKDKLVGRGLIIIPVMDDMKKLESNLITTDNPKKTFFSILKYFYEENNIIKMGKHNNISPLSNIAEDVSIGDHCIIEDNVQIGSGTKIYNNVVIKKGIKIGKNCVIKSGAIIGEEGFGHIENDDNSLERIPHLGSVVIGDDVEIGSNTCIDRGVLSNTIVSNGSKIHNLCQIAHNVFIDENCFIAPNTNIFGSVIIGRNCHIGGAMIKNQVKIGNNVLVGMGAVVVKDVEDNKVVAGVPAKVIRDNL